PLLLQTHQRDADGLARDTQLGGEVHFGEPLVRAVRAGEDALPNHQVRPITAPRVRGSGLRALLPHAHAPSVDHARFALTIARTRAHTSAGRCIAALTAF